MPSVARPRRPEARSAKETASDDLVMQTNSSSIVSKRSVERIYYPDEAHYFRYFVNKFQRRAPLINRGYYLRLHAIDCAVRRFLERPGSKTKVVINLGCGSDVLPWQCMTRYPDACRSAKFVDIDFPALMSKKRAIVLNTPELSSVFEPFDTDVGDHVLLSSSRYFQIGCDLRNTPDIDKALSLCLDPSDCIFMFVAEVSITYMETPGADGVIKWASSLNQAEFCLLEQILPGGPDHPFAKTMLAHFEKLKTPLKSVFEYPGLDAQKRRFHHLGWPHVRPLSLWDVWTDDSWISASKRREIDLVEPFDEWEEFVLFASHYCVITARNFGSDIEPPDSDSVALRDEPAQIHRELLFNPHSGTQGRRRFGAALQIRGGGFGEQIYANTFGLGTNNRLKSCDLYAFGSSVPGMDIDSAGPGSRVCHAIVGLGQFGSLLIGGRTSPTTALRDCWHFSRERNKWSRTDDLPLPLYRHGVAQLGRTNMTLLIGGKIDSSTVFAGCLVHKPGHGWIECNISGSAYQPVFGATLVCFREHHLVDDSEPPATRFKGIIAGGILEDGTVARRVLRWSLKLPANDRPTISFRPISNSTKIDTLLCRFGASAVIDDDEHVVIVGGVQHDGIVLQANEILLMDISDSRPEIFANCSLTDSKRPSDYPRPMLVGIATSLAENGQLLVMGGGATCFSMGTYWNEGCYILDLQYNLYRPNRNTTQYSFKFQKLIEIVDKPQPTGVYDNDTGPRRAKLSHIPRAQVSTEDEFEKILRAGKPVIIEGGDLGTCVSKWTTGYLIEKVGPQRKIVVHEATSPNMDFNSKNFSYTTKEFGSFMIDVERGDKQYLRALSEEHPSDRPANIEVDFPHLADDFQIPPELAFVKRNQFSSVLRISGRVNMWLHYDVMANIYCQISGSKKLLLFPPSDMGRLSFAPGASSSSIDVFAGLETSALALTHPHEAILGPGDILFLPPLWMHATAPLTDLGVAVNVFFRNLETGYSSGRDVYGNRDVAAYEKARQDVARITNSFSKLPRDMQAFYLRRLADELAQNIVE
ncbi:leucine carboxyl methyltransferase [Nemania sp. FL0916]|nr:leucine carboxyl methyltransferase [Nemania sp. FL0916]